MLRLYVRIKTKYDPAKANDALLFVDAQPTTTIGHVKQEAKRKASGSKIDSLYFRREDGSYGSLADDRLISYYNIQNRTVLETTSNPFWAAAIYARLDEVKNHAAENPDDSATVEGAQKSAICRYMALGILFNGNNNQPPYCESFEELYNHLMTAGKKPAYMSQTTRNTLQAMKEDFMLYDQYMEDPVGHFIHRQAVRLGFVLENEVNVVRMPDGVDDHEPQGANAGSGIRNPTENRVIRRPDARGGDMTRQNRGGRGRRRAAMPEQICQYCDEAAAAVYCAECQPPLLLCNQCAADLHARERRRNHQLQDVLDGPAPMRGTNYHPQPYRAPFAMLVAFYRALREVPQRMSLTADELKARAQPLTGSDLQDKQGAKRFSGFDSLEKTLIRNDLVVKMAAHPPRYSLLENGENLASRCSEFDYAVQSHRQRESVPAVPIAGVRPVFQNCQICLLVDSDEPLKDRFMQVVRQMGLAVKMRKLPVGDFAWILLPQGVNPDTARDMPEQELVLPYLVERKTWGDLWASSKTNRFLSQVQRMKACGLANLFYLVEGSPKDIYGNPGPELQNYLQNLVDKLMLEDRFLLNRTGSWLKTVHWLCHLTNMAAEKLNSGPNPELMTFSEFNKAGRRRRDDRAHVSAVPVRSTVWKASCFADNLKSHNHDGISLANAAGLPGRCPAGQLPNVLLVIQGLTAYNTRCHSLLNKALTDLLNHPTQAAEECVHRHLHGLASQLIDQDVFQYYILWLQVFKGVMVRRTETDQETQAITATTDQADSVAHAAREQPVGMEQVHNAPVRENSAVQDFVFAHDSQEEELMLQQALTQSGGDANDAQANTDDMDGDEQLRLALIMSKAEFNASQSITRPHSPGQGSTRIPSHPLPLIETSTRKPKDDVEKRSTSSPDSPHSSAQKDLHQGPWRNEGMIDDPHRASLHPSVHTSPGKNWHDVEKSSQESSCSSSAHKESYQRSDEVSCNTSVSGSCEGDVIFVESHEVDDDLPGMLATTADENLRPWEASHETNGCGSHEDAIFVESQEVDADLPEVLGTKAGSPDGSRASVQHSCEDDHTLALKLHEELNKSSGHGVIEPANNDVEVIGIQKDSAEKIQDRSRNNAVSNRLPSGTAGGNTGIGDDLAFALEIQKQLDEQGSKTSEKTRSNDPLPASHEEDDFAYALKLQKELNNEHQVPKSQSAGTGESVQTEMTGNDQIRAYRERQRQKYGARVSGKTAKPSPGLAFRRNVEAIAAGKRIDVGILNPAAVRSPKSGRAAKSVSSPTTRKLGSSDGGQFRHQLSTPDEKPEVPLARASSAGKPNILFPTDQTCSSSPYLSATPNRYPGNQDKHETGILALPGCSSATASPSKEASQSKSTWAGGSPSRTGPKCGACGNIGHSRSSTRCPQYYSLESTLKREEASRKRKAQREAEERELQDQLGNLATQRVNLENQTAALGQQIQALRRQSSDLINTHKLVEGALGGKRKRRR